MATMLKVRGGNKLKNEAISGAEAVAASGTYIDLRGILYYQCYVFHIELSCRLFQDNCLCMRA
ncbi:hypothetical protein TSUD_355480 [Trifolium subterraneum]|uniref:Uncharacterized protein n=1 Tax=Trifolium subterraneum TaxID=3900 RepID=A0A2Z6MZY3_TRISU|nr:hypothetical protein TSUD_355480 [Trifolium subterraneum]